MNPGKSTVILLWQIPAGSARLVQIASKTGASLDDVSTGLPGGAYTTFRTYRGDQALDLEGHLSRLEETARLAGQPVTLDQDTVCNALRQVIHEYPQRLPPGAPVPADLRLRLTLDLEAEIGSLYITAEALHTLPEEAYTSGVHAITTHLQRSNPKAKLTGFISQAGELRSSLPAEVNEALMVDARRLVLEGLSSNFFAVRRGELWTAGQSVLSGITRRQVLDCARRLEIPLRLEAIRVEELVTLDEAFISSSSRGILPVVKIDDLVICAGQPGPVTRRLMQAFQDALDTHLRRI